MVQHVLVMMIVARYTPRWKRAYNLSLGVWLNGGSSKMLPVDGQTLIVSLAYDKTHPTDSL